MINLTKVCCHSMTDDRPKAEFLLFAHCISFLASHKDKQAACTSTPGTMDPLYRFVVALNNKGAACIHNDLPSAKAFFEKALESAMAIFLMSSVPAESRIRLFGTTDSCPTPVHLSTEEKRTLEKIPIIAESTFVRAIVLNESPIA